MMASCNLKECTTLRHRSDLPGRGAARPGARNLVTRVLRRAPWLSGLLASGLTALPVEAPSFLITGLHVDEDGQAVIAYQSSPNSEFHLLKGPSVAQVDTVVAVNEGVTGEDAFTVPLDPSGEAGFFRIRQEWPLTRVISSPVGGQSAVSPNAEVILDFSQALSGELQVDPSLILTRYAGVALPKEVSLSSDRKRLRITFLQPLPPAARIRLQFDGADFPDFLGRSTDGNADGVEGGLATIEFDTAGARPVTATAIMGTVFGAALGVGELHQTNLIKVALEGAQITIVGAEDGVQTVTGAEGRFTLSPCPAGEFFVRVDGRSATASQWPDGGFYGELHASWTAVAGRGDNLAGIGGQVLLPWVPAGSISEFDPASETVLTLAAQVVQEHPELAQASVTLPAANIGLRGPALARRVGLHGEVPTLWVGIVPVASAALEEPVSAETPMVAAMRLISSESIQLDEPAPVRLPNLPDPFTGETLAAGEKSALWSYNEELSQWQLAGPMTVSVDGAYLQSDLGVGVERDGVFGAAPAGTMNAEFLQFDLADLPTLEEPELVEDLLAVEALGAALTVMEIGDVQGLDDLDGDQLIAATEAFLAAEAKLAQAFPEAQVGLHSGSRRLMAQRDTILATSGLIKEIRNLIRKGKTSALDSAEKNRLQTGLQNLRDSSNQASEQHKDLAKRITKRNSITFSKLGTGGYQVHYKPKVVKRIPQSGSDASFNPVKVGGTRSKDVNVAVRSQTRSPMVAAYHPQMRVLASAVHPDVIASGLQHPLPPSLFITPPTEDGWVPDADLDGDGLSDGAEHTLGTDMMNPDTDGDGVDDGTEVEFGLDPLDASEGHTGLIASAATPGNALDVNALNNRVVVACGDAGLAVYDTAGGSDPVLMGRLDTPGQCSAVAMTRGYAGVADGSMGLVLADVSDPASARIIRQVPADSLGGGLVQAVAAAGDFVFAGTASGSVSMVEVPTGLILRTLRLDPPVQDLAVEGLTLYAVAGEKLHAIPFRSGALVAGGEVGISEVMAAAIPGRKRLFVGNDIAYVTSHAGYETFDVRDAAAMTRLGQVMSELTSFKQIVPNGSGGGLGVQGVDNPATAEGHGVGLYDLRDSTVTDTLLTTFETPGVARAISVYDGLGYVADGVAGLQVLRYRAHDTNNVAPSGLIRLSPDGSAGAGQLIVVRAEVQDDVQVRSVDFLLNKQKLATDGSFPFEIVYRAPLDQVGSSLQFSAVVRDTGGNLGATGAPPLPIVADTQTPSVVILSPEIGDVLEVPAPLDLLVSAYDAGGVESLHFELKGEPVESYRLDGGYHRLRVPPGLGTYQLRAVAADFAGNEGRSAVTFITVNGGAASREVSVFNYRRLGFRWAVSREVSAFVPRLDPVVRAVSREVSVSVIP